MGTRGREVKEQEKYLENMTCQERLKKTVLFSSREENVMGRVIMDFYVHRNMLLK